MSFFKNSAATAGSVSKPYVKATLHALPTCPAPVRIVALAVFEKVTESNEAELVEALTQSAWASFESMSRR